MSKIYFLKTIQKIPAGIDAAWNFFSRPENLKLITPQKLGLHIISKHYGEAIYSGQIIEYKIHPLPGLPIYWMTEITHVEPNKYFIDEQRYGPYSIWHHQHHFKVIENGVEMTDIIHYKIPFWFLGDIANRIFVQPELKKIFQFRFTVVQEKFGAWKESII